MMLVSCCDAKSGRMNASINEFDSLLNLLIVFWNGALLNGISMWILLPEHLFVYIVYELLFPSSSMKFKKIKLNFRKL